MSFSLLGRNIARYKELDTLRLTTLPLLIGGALSLVLGFLIEGWPLFTNKGAWIVAWLAIVNTALGYLLYNHSLQDLTALEMNMVMNLSPLFTALLGWLILGESLAPIQFIGMIIMILGVFLVQMRNTPFVKLN
jgi:probable blue pigment (indigoidine) exporter